MSTITWEKIQEAKKQEEKGERITDPAIQMLKSNVHAAAGKVMGTNAGRHRLKSEIWSTSIALGPPSLWITINPCDLHDPIAQVFAGEGIDLDQFLETIGPDADTRAQNISNDPYASSRFFHFMVRTILTTLFGVKRTKFQVRSEKGIFGHIAAYFGVVESQGRGTLHLHILLWLMNSPSIAEIFELLKTEEFRSKVTEFIRTNIKGYAPGFESADTVKAIPRKTDVAYSRPPNPFPDTAQDISSDAGDSYDARCQEFELKVARSKQVHTCELRRCLKVDKRGGLVCKRRAPFDVSAEPYVNEDGTWGAERRYGYMNCWNPSISLCMRCNNDIKVLLNGRESVSITYYVTGYSGKNQQKNHNISALVAKTYAYHIENSAYVDSLQDQQRLLMLRTINAMNSERELAAPMVVSLLMGWGETYKSHTYTNVYWSGFVSQLVKEFPTLVGSNAE
jgi:hypothetical protein